MLRSIFHVIADDFNIFFYVHIWEMIQFDLRMFFQMETINHQLDALQKTIKGSWEDEFVPQKNPPPIGEIC